MHQALSWVTLESETWKMVPALKERMVYKNVTIRKILIIVTSKI